MIISIAVITYNQEATISQTLDSILMQKGDFYMEIIVGEDCSTDNTKKIVSEYQSKYPDIIKPIFQPENRGILGNSIDVFRACTGEYINMIAGDDYWIDECKLAKQVAFLEANPNYGLVATDGYKLYVKDNKLISGLPPEKPIVSGEVFTRFVSNFGVYAMPLTVLFRANLLQYIDFDEFEKRKFSVEDTPLQAIFSHHTKFGYIPDRTSVYRIYKDSATFISFNHPKYIDYHKGLVAIRKYLDELFPDEVDYSDEWSNEYIFYREYLRLLHFLKYRSAKKLIAQYSGILSHNAKYIKSKKMTASLLSFVLFHFFKECSYTKNLSKQL